MKKIFVITSLLISVTFEANAQSEKAIAVVLKISKQMVDSVKITEEERVKVYNVNLRLHNEKSAWRLRFAETDSLAKYFQIVENTRDSLYKEILPEAKYLEYLKRKKQVIKN